MVVLSFLLVTLALLVAVLVAIFLVEVVAAIALPRRNCLPLSRDSIHTVAVLVPAHDESAGLTATLANIKAQIAAADRLLVVADNCADDTAAHHS